MLVPVPVQTFGLGTHIATDTAQKMVLLITTILFHVKNIEKSLMAYGAPVLSFT